MESIIQIKNLNKKYEDGFWALRDVNLEIKKDNLGTTYNLSIPKIDIATSALLKKIRNELVSVTAISMSELTDPSAFSSIKERFLKEARKHFKNSTVAEDFMRVEL